MFRDGKWLGFTLTTTLCACVFDGDDAPGPGGDAAVADAAVAASCVDDATCSDGRFCNGIERCTAGDADGGPGACAPAERGPCMRPELCDEAAQFCLPDCRLHPDADGDTQWDERCGGTDCDDNDRNVYFGADEVCDAEGHDEDCNPDTLHNIEENDGDQDGDRHISTGCCNLVRRRNGEQFLDCGTDCNDDDADVNPSQLEAPTCDFVDSNCDGEGEDCTACTCVIPNAIFDCPEHPDNCQPITCWHGFMACDGSLLNGCETAISTEANCGGCDQVCPDHATCVAHGAQFRCVCDPYFVEVDGACRDRNECLDNHGGCDSAADCENVVGGRVCRCGDGYAGDGEVEGGCVPALKSLRLSAGTLLPALDRDVTRYEVELPIAAETIALTPVVNSGASVTIEGQATTPGATWRSPLLALGANVFELTVAETGRSPRHYTLTVHRGFEQAYLKASNADYGDQLGKYVAISGDTIVVGAPNESSSATGVDGDDTDAANDSGAAYVFRRSDGAWIQEAFLKASNTGEADHFGASVAVSGDTVVVGAPNEASSARGVGANQADDSAERAGAAYVFVRGADGAWSQQAYLKASNAAAASEFGIAVGIDGDTIVVGAHWESSAPPNWTPTADIPVAEASGAAYVFVRGADGAWSQQAMFKAPSGDAWDYFGNGVAISGDTIVVGAPFEDSAATEVDGDPTDDSADGQGAAYVFVRSAGSWSQQAYLKSVVATGWDYFGWSVAISADTIVIGAPGQPIAPAGGAGARPLEGAGAAHVFDRQGGAWTARQLLTAGNVDEADGFGTTVAISGPMIVVGAPFEDSAATGFGGEPANDSAASAGAAYVFARADGWWSQQAYVKASNTERANFTSANDLFGSSVAISGDTIVAGTPFEDSSATVVNGDGSDNGATDSGAAYVFR